MDTKTIVQLRHVDESKWHIFKRTGIEFDGALPVNWLHDFANWCKANAPSVTQDMIMTTTVWAYTEESILGKPMTCCTEVKAALEKYDEWWTNG